MDQHTPSVSDILDPAGKDIIKRLKDTDDLVLLVGSKISEWYPSNVPSGMETTSQIADLLASQFPDANEHKKASSYIRHTPFEYIFDKCPRQDMIRSLLGDVFSVATPNAVHESIGRLVMNARIHSVITPNYDLCLDAVLPNGKPLSHVVLPDEASDLLPASRVLFKIHGSAAPGLTSTMVLSLSDEGLLPAWKQGLLRTCLAGRTILVMGFSGLDFEISPHLVKSNPRLVVWNSYGNPLKSSEALTPNAKRILSSCPSIVIHGDLRHILAELDSPFIWHNPSPSMESIGRRIAGRLSDIDLKIWAASVLSSPGYARYAETIANDLRNIAALEDSALATALLLLGDSLFSRGRYRDSADYTAKAALMFLKDGDVPRYVSCEAKGIDALRSSGRFGRAYKRLANARGRLSQSLSNKENGPKIKLDLQEILIIREQYARYTYLQKFRIPGVAQRIQAAQSKARDLLKAVLDISIKNGQWHDIQQCRMWAGRLNIPFSELYDGPLQPLDDLAGWQHLGHAVPEMMSLRGALAKHNYAEAPEETVRAHILTAKDIGCDPEVWKLTLALWKHYGWRLGDSQFDWIASFVRCQYTMVMRLVKLIYEQYR